MPFDVKCRQRIVDHKTQKLLHLDSGEEKLTIAQNDVPRAGVVYSSTLLDCKNAFIPENVNTIILNLTNNGLLFHNDEVIIRYHAGTIVHGLLQIKSMTKAETIIIATTENLSEIADLIVSKLGSNAQYVLIPDVYPSNDYILLIYLALGLSVHPHNAHELVDIAVLNAETTFNIGQIQHSPVVNKFVSIVGEVNHPGVICVPIGTSLSNCLDIVGGITIPNPAYIEGDVMTGRLISEVEGLIDKCTSGFVVLPDDHIIVQRKTEPARLSSYRKKLECNQCARCTELCPRNLLGNTIKPHRVMDVSLNDSGTDYSLACSRCNLCSYYSCPLELAPLDEIMRRQSRSLLASQVIPTNTIHFPDRPARFTTSRLIPTRRLLQHLQLEKYDFESMLVEKPKSTIRQVNLSLIQSHDSKALPLVQEGDYVSRGQIVAIRKRPMTTNEIGSGADIHASIDGVVTQITSDVIVISSSNPQE